MWQKRKSSVNPAEWDKAQAKRSFGHLRAMTLCGCSLITPAKMAAVRSRLRAASMET
jgi:hypothetical protein